MVPPKFRSYLGIDYSGAETADSSLKGIRVYRAGRETKTVEILPPCGPKRYWTRRGLAEWLIEEILRGAPILIGIDHGFSFPIDYFNRHGLGPDWGAFLDDFQSHWPTDKKNLYVDFIRDGLHGQGAARTGDARWLRLTERWTSSASSVFRFDVQGSVAKSTHAGLPWLRQIRQNVGDKSHFWPFDGWDVPLGKSCLVEVFPSLFRKRYPSEDRDPHQQDAFAVAQWLQQMDENGSLPRFLAPAITPEDRTLAQIEGWILGVT